MNGLRRLLSDLALLVGVVLHPVRWWRAWRSIAAELFRQGGVTIDTPTADEDDAITLRTVIQPDGDVLVFVRDGVDPDATLVAEHGRRVTRWYEGSRTAVHQAAGALRALTSLVSLGAAAGGEAATVARTDGLAELVVGSLVSLGLFPVGRVVLGALASWFLRRRMDRWLGGARLAG